MLEIQKSGDKTSSVENGLDQIKKLKTNFHACFNILVDSEFLPVVPSSFF